MTSTAAKGVRWVLWLTLATMVVEIVVGLMSGSMALLADGWHMGTHAAAFAVTLFAYRYATKHAADPSFCFGTGKVNDLGAFASAIALGTVALMMAVESIERLFNPRPIHYQYAMIAATIGLAVNIASVFLLHNPHQEHHHDHNLRAAFFHVLADALTSVLAIAALLAGQLWGSYWLDPLMGIVGAAIIAFWAKGLIRDTAPTLLDRQIGPVESNGNRVQWSLGQGKVATWHRLNQWPTPEQAERLITSEQAPQLFSVDSTTKR